MMAIASLLLYLPVAIETQSQDIEQVQAEKITKLLGREGLKNGRSIQ